jgi:hypothetical protein
VKLFGGSIIKHLQGTQIFLKGQIGKDRINVKAISDPMLVGSLHDAFDRTELGHVVVVVVVVVGTGVGSRFGSRKGRGRNAER